MKVSFRTDKGLVKSDNQDALAVREFNDGSLLVGVADGLSGQPGAGRASAIARQCILNFAPALSSIRSQLEHLFQTCDRTIQQATEEELPNQEMGTTLTVAFILEGTAYWAHVGDCRLYLCRRGTHVQITEDDTLAAFLVARGKLTREEARRDSSRHGLFECLGRGALEIKSGDFSVQRGDLLLLTSDGLHDEISDEMVRSVVQSTLDLDGKLDQLVRLSKEAGGSDNITVIGVEI